MTAGAKSLTTDATTAASGRSAALTESASACRIYVDAMSRLGFDTDALLQHAGIGRSDLNDVDGRIPCPAVGAMLGMAEQQQRVKNLGMRIALETPIGAFPLIDHLVLTSESAGQGLEQLARYFRLVASAVTLRFHREDDAMCVIYDGPPGALPYEFGVTLCLLHLREETNGSFHAASVSFAHVPDDPRELERVLECPVHLRASWNGWTMSQQAWELPFRRRDPILRGVLERQANEMMARLPASGGVALDVRRILVARGTGGDTRIETVARTVGVSVRSLQRRLSEEGHSFHDLVEAARKDAAERFLADSSLSIGEVGFLLGYSEVAAFHRAFKRWNGVTPQDFRRRWS